MKVFRLFLAELHVFMTFTFRFLSRPQRAPARGVHRVTVLRWRRVQPAAMYSASAFEQQRQT